MSSTDYENLNTEVEVMSGKSSFSIVKRNVNGTVKTILKHSIELDLENRGIGEAIEEFSKILQRACYKS